MGCSTFLSELFGCFRIWKLSQKFLGTKIGVRYESQCKSNSCNYQSYRPNSKFFTNLNMALFHGINHCRTHQKGHRKCFVQNGFMYTFGKSQYFIICDSTAIRSSVGFKGQLISKYPFGVFKSPKKTKEFFPGFLH